MNKKKILTLCLVACLAITAIAGASLAYFTDTKSATNTFTVGNVSIDLIESRYHRQGSGSSGDTSIPAPDKTASGMKYVGDGATIYSDDEIKADAANYLNYITERGKNMVPGKFIAKSPYVVNTGSVDAYIRIRVMVPSNANEDYLYENKGGVIKTQFCTMAIKSGEFACGTVGDSPKKTPKGYTDDNGVQYDVYTFVRNEPLAPGAMTEWNVWNFVGISEKATSANIQTAIDNGAIILDNGTMTANVLVQADAIQADGFDTAAAAFKAFDKA